MEQQSGTDLPLYTRLKHALRAAIAAGQHRPHQSIPSERELSALHGMSRMTVRHALDDLVSEGILYRAPGRGTFVAGPKIYQALGRVTSFTEDMRARGLEPGARQLKTETVPAPGECQQALGLTDAAPVLRVRRLRTADGEPMALETVHLPLELFPGLTELEPASQSLYRLLEERYGVKIARARQTIEPAAAMARDARHLGVTEGSLLLALERVTYDSEGRAVEYVRSLYRGDRYKFVVELTGR